MSPQPASLFRPPSSHSVLTPASALRRPRPRPANDNSVEDAFVSGSVFGITIRAPPPAISSAMSDWFSLSVLQILSVLSFITSVLAVVRVGAGSLNRLQHKFEADVNQPASGMNVAASVKFPPWNWKVSGLPVSFSLGSILGEDESEETEEAMGPYNGGSPLIRMDWQVTRPQIGTSVALAGRVNVHLITNSSGSSASILTTTSIYG